MRKVLSVLAAGAIALCAGGCASSNREAYEFAEHCIGLGEYETAAEYFRQLGEYRDSADYLLYVDALMALVEGDLTLARANFEQVAPFKSAERYLQCIEAMELEKAGDFDAALDIYRRLGTFANSDQRASRLESEIPERERDACRDMMDDGDYADALERLRSLEKSTETAKMIAECETALERLAYEEACALYDAGRLEEAIGKFEALGDMLDAPARLAACRSKLYRDALETDVTLETLPALLETYALLGDYLDSAARLAGLQARSECNAAISASAYVRMGSVTNPDTGMSVPVIWRVEAVLGSAVQLACETTADVAWTPRERENVLDVAIRHASPEPLFTVREQSAKPFADSVPVMASGVRHMLVLVDLTDAPFSAGDGSAASPYTMAQ